MSSKPAPSAPNWLAVRAREKWTETWQQIDPGRVKPEQHAYIVAIFCQAYADYCEASENINDIGLVIKSGSRSIANPCVAIRDKAAKTMVDLGFNLGLSPSALGA